MTEFLDTLIEIKFDKPDDFLKIKETLTRIGIASKKEKKMWQSCHILHKQEKYYLVHFKEMFSLDNKETNFSIEDIGRRNRIALLLQSWGLFDIVDMKMVEEPLASMSGIKILSYKEKYDWILKSKYNMGKKR